MFSAESILGKLTTDYPNSKLDSAVNGFSALFVEIDYRIETLLKLKDGASLYLDIARGSTPGDGPLFCIVLLCMSASSSERKRALTDSMFRTFMSGSLFFLKYFLLESEICNGLVD